MINLDSRQLILESEGFFTAYILIRQHAVCSSPEVAYVYFTNHKNAAFSTGAKASIFNVNLRSILTSICYKDLFLVTAKWCLVNNSEIGLIKYTWL